MADTTDDNSSQLNNHVDGEHVNGHSGNVDGNSDVRYVNQHDDRVDIGQGTDDANDSFLLMSYLDEVEDRVEELRRSALSLSQERDSLLTVLSQLKNDRLNYCLTTDQSSEIVTTIDQLKSRCETVGINITSPRTAEQETSYQLVNSLLVQMERTCCLGDTDRSAFTCQAQGYLNACVSDGNPHGPVDYKFQGMVLGCKLEDQKLVRQRLECLVKGTCHADFVTQCLHNQRLSTNGAVDG